MRYSFSTLAGSLVTALAAMSFAAAAEAVKLTFSYYTSDREVIYLSAVKPFIDSVNAAANGLIEIDAFTSGSLGKSYAGQAQLVLDGGADFAFVNPGLTPEQFPDDGVMELPGLFRDVREASVVYTRLVASGTLRGYEDFFVVGAVVGGPQSIHTSKTRLGGISKRGDSYLRRLLVNSAHTVLLCSKAAKTDPWLTSLLGRKPRLVAAVALANKTARIAWAIMSRQDTYRHVAAAA